MRELPLLHMTAPPSQRFLAPLPSPPLLLSSFLFFSVSGVCRSRRAHAGSKKKKKKRFEEREVQGQREFALTRGRSLLAPRCSPAQLTPPSGEERFLAPFLHRPSRGASCAAHAERLRSVLGRLTSALGGMGSAARPRVTSAEPDRVFEFEKR